VQDAVEECNVTARFDRQKQIASASNRRDARIHDDNLRAVLARLPNIVRSYGSALGNIRPANPNYFGLRNVRPWIRRAINAKGFLIGSAGADHAKPAIVIDVRSLQAHARKLPHQISFLGGQTRAGENAEGVVAVSCLDSLDLSGDKLDRFVIGHLAKSTFSRRVALICMEQTVGMGALQIALHAFWAEHAAIEREIFPRLEADHLIVFDLELNAALLAAKAAVGLHKVVRLDTGLEPRAG
jgi:hypothetical protein